MSTIENSVWSLKELSELKNVDRLLPSQPYFSKQYTDNPAEYFNRMEGLMLSVQPHKSIEEKWDIELKDGMTYAAMGSELSTLRFYQMLIKIGGYRNVLELGTYIGVSALFLAEAVEPHGKVTTVEAGQEFYEIAKSNIERNKKSIDQVHGCALATLKAYAEEKRKFDFILIDSGKELYDEMLYPALVCLSAGGLLLVDDVFFQGDTLNHIPATPKGAGVRRMLDIVELLQGYDKVILPLGNGVLMIRKSA